VDQFVYSESGENKSYPWTVHSDDMTHGVLWNHSRHEHKMPLLLNTRKLVLGTKVPLSYP